MYKRTTLEQVLSLLPRRKIKEIVRERQSDRYRKSFKSWDHLMTMLIGQFAGMNSLRELEVAMNHHSQCHYHMNIGHVRRSTLSDANKTRSYELFQDICGEMVNFLGRQSRDIKKILTVLDSSLIHLRGRGNEWTKESVMRLHNTGLKLHLAYNKSAESIEYAVVTATTVNDLTIAKEQAIQNNRLYVFDKAYCDYEWWQQMHDHGAWFVTRLKKNASYKVIETHEVDANERVVLKDQTIILTNKKSKRQGKKRSTGIMLRLVQIKHPSGKETPFMIVSNAMIASAQEIAGWYKERWSIELLFKWLKQNLNFRRFLGENRNAVMIQIYIAIIAYCLLKLYKSQTHQLHTRLKDILIFIQTTLFVRPRLYEYMQKRRQLLHIASPQLMMVF